MCKFFQMLFGKKTPTPTPNPDPDTDVLVEDPPIEEEPLIETPSDPTPIVSYPLKALNVEGVALEPGTDYFVTFDDLEPGGQFIDYEKVAEDHGMHESTLSAFNNNKPFKVDDQVYIPSIEELCFYEYCLQHKELEAAKANYLQMEEWPNKKLLATARYRGAGQIGKSYGTSSLVFLSPNTDLVGAVDHRTEVVNGETLFKVNWGPDLWKCNIFVHDVVFAAGYKPDLMSNNHYITAGSLQNSNLFEQLKIDEVTPGCIIQLYSGSGSNASHNMVLMSFIERSKVDATTEKWIFRAMGAEQDRVAVSYRQHFVSMEEHEDYYKVREDIDSSTREYVRMFKPLYKQEIV